MKEIRKQSTREEIFNGMSHAAGLVFFLVLMPWLFRNVRHFRDGELLWTVYVFGFGIVSTYFSSAVYHFMPRGIWKDRWRIIDHISIFFLIGGTYTPVIIQYLSAPYRLIFMGIMWTIIFAGAILKFWWTGKYDHWSTALYVFLGWMLLFVIWPIWQNTPGLVFTWIIGGGLSYTVGIYFYRKSDRLYNHVVWHSFVILGTLCHWIAIFLSFQG